MLLKDKGWLLKTNFVERGFFILYSIKIYIYLEIIYFIVYIYLLYDDKIKN
jgi:hypothetical protein